MVSVMSNIPDVDLFDDDGYPTDEALAAVDAFQGTAAEYVAFVSILYTQQGYGKAVLVDRVNDFGRDRKELTLVTGGWSGCEDVLSRIRNSFFHVTFWQASFRGGKDIYDIPADMWDSEMTWGSLRQFLDEAAPGL